MAWSDIILALISFVTGGGLTGLITIRQSKNRAEIDNASALVAEYKSLLEEYKANHDKDQEKIEALTKDINDMKIELAGMKAKMEQMKTISANAVLLKCDNINCRKRRPPLKPEALESLGIEEQEEEK